MHGKQEEWEEFIYIWQRTLRRLDGGGVQLAHGEVRHPVETKASLQGRDDHRVWPREAGMERCRLSQNWILILIMGPWPLSIPMVGRRELFSWWTFLSNTGAPWQGLDPIFMFPQCPALDWTQSSAWQVFAEWIFSLDLSSSSSFFLTVVKIYVT